MAGPERVGWRRSAVTLLGVAGTLLLTSCGVPTGGIIGLTLTEDRHIAVVVAMCRGSIDGVTLYEANDQEPERSADHGDWESDTTHTSTQFVADTLTPGGTWTAEQAWDGTVPATSTYVIFGGTRDASWSTYPLEFTQAEIKKLRAGKVLVPDLKFGGEQTGNRLANPSELTRLACRAAA